ncbi:YdeI/OmpD-associated family protein [Agromyces sp. NPDC004153]
MRRSALGPDAVYVSAQDINEECLCFGWIDSRPAAIDDARTALLCTPRKPGGGWSKVNKVRLERLLDEGLVAAAGLAAIERAKANGSWSKLDEVETLTIPDDLAEALDAYPEARSKFDGFPPSARRAVLEWIASARREATRSARIAETASLADRGIRANQWPRDRSPGSTRDG